MNSKFLIVGKTKHCVVCGGEAIDWAGHVHTDSMVLAGWCCKLDKPPASHMEMRSKSRSYKSGCEISSDGMGCLGYVGIDLNMPTIINT